MAAAAFPSSQQLTSWIGVCPGSEESAGENHSGRSAKGNRFLRRVLCQAAQPAARTKDSQLQIIFERLVVRLGYAKAIWALAHRICKIIWNILHQGASFIEFSEARSPKAIDRAITHHLKALRRLGFNCAFASPDRGCPGVISTERSSAFFSNLMGQLSRHTAHRDLRFNFGEGLFLR